MLSQVVAACSRTVTRRSISLDSRWESGAAAAEDGDAAGAEIGIGVRIVVATAAASAAPVLGS